MDRLKILVTAERFPPEVFGGGENSAYLLAKTLAEHNEVHVITITASSKGVQDNSTEVERRDGMHIHRIVPPVNPLFPEYLRNHELFYTQSFRKIDGFLKTHDDFDLIHSLSMNMVVGSVLSAKLRHLPIIATVNDHWATCYFRNHYFNNSLCLTCSGDGLKECTQTHIGRTKGLPYIKGSMKLRKYFLSKCDGLIAISDKVKEILVANGFNKPIETIPILIDPDVFNYEEPRYDNKVLFISRIDPGKGTEVAIRAFAHANIGMLVIVGTGTRLDYCKNLVYELGIVDKVEFKGNISYNEVPEMIHQCDIVLTPFQRVEAFGRVLLEAAACGRGVITTEIGGGGQMFVINGENGYSFKPDDIEGMGDCIRNVLSERKVIKKLGATGRKMVLEQMKKGSVSQKIDSFYEKILGSKTK